MSTTTQNQALRARVDQFVQEITSMVRASALESVRAALGGDAGAVRRRVGRPAGSVSAQPRAMGSTKRRDKRGLRTSEEIEQTAARVLDYVKANPGQDLNKIAKGMRTTTAELTLPVTKLKASKAVKTTGQRRGTKYFAAGASVARNIAAKTGRKVKRKRAGRKSA